MKKPRIVITDADVLTLLRPVIDAVEDLLQSQARVLLVMDGMSCAGKTTATQALSRRWNAPVVHMDDFYLPRDLRVPERLAEPGGNVHYERFLEEVLPHLAAGEAFSYRVFDCGTMEYGGLAHIPAAAVTIVEGAYAMHPVFGDYGDITVFFSIDPETQMQRVSRREPGKEDDYESRWIPMENAYHAAFRTRERADIVLCAME